MTKFPDDDGLVNFLRQHASAVPPAAPDLEQQVMAAVAASPRLPVKHQKLWLVPTAVAIAVIAWAGHRLLMPVAPSATELAGIEAFMESSWDGVLSSPSIAAE